MRVVLPQEPVKRVPTLVESRTGRVGRLDQPRNGVVCEGGCLTQWIRRTCQVAKTVVLERRGIAHRIGDACRKSIRADPDSGLVAARVDDGIEVPETVVFV